MSDVLLTMALLLAAMLVYRFRRPLLAPLRRFDARNVARRMDEARDRHDRFAHYRRSVLTAEESLEEPRPVTVHDERTGQPLKRYLFLGEHYETMNEAAAARRMRAIQIAREFYAELDGKTLPKEAPPDPPRERSLPQLLRPPNERLH